MSLMSEANELFSPGRHPKVHPDVMSAFVRANIAHPQMYGGMILRAGRVAYDLMMDGKISASNFSRSLPDAKQIADIGERAVKAHKHAGIDMPFLQHGGKEEIDMGFLTPVSMRGVYMRTRRGILKTIHSYALNALQVPSDAPQNPASERVFMAKRLLKPENREAASILQAMWRTADDAATGRPIAEATGMLHRTFSSLPEESKAKTAEIAIATRAARSAFQGLIIPALQPLKQQAASVLGLVTAEDVVDTFPLDVIHEGKDELTDEDIASIRANGIISFNLTDIDF